MNEHFEIWDVHCHLSGVPGNTPQKRLDHLLEFADRMRVAKLCLYMGMQWDYDPSPEKIRKDNDEVLQALEHRPDRVLGFVYLNPKHTDASLAELERCVANGPMVGIKLWVAQRCDNAALDPILKRAEELQAVVFQHTWLKVSGNLPGESTPQDLSNLAARHPRAKIVCGHSGGDWELGLRAIRSRPNIHAGLGGGDPTSGFTEMAVRELGADRIVFGSDIGGRSFSSQLAKVFGADLSDESKRLILGGNLRRLLRPILESKGIKV